MPSYAPPIEDRTSPISLDPREVAANPMAYNLFRFYKQRAQGINIYRLTDGTYTRIQPATYDTIDRIFWGGHTEPVTQAERAAIEASGVGGTFTDFDPRVIPGCIAWWGADQITGLSDGDPVASWSQKIEETHIPAITQATASKRPLYKTNILNGHPVVRFDGVDDFLRSNTWPMGLGIPFTLLAVFSLAGTANRHLIDGLNLTPRLNIFRSAGNTFATQIVRSADSAFRQIRGASISTSAIACSVTIDNDINIVPRINGAPDTPLTLDSHSANYRDFQGLGYHIDGITLGARFDGLFAGQCDIAELCFYEGVLDAADLASLTADLQTKYGI